MALRSRVLPTTLIASAVALCSLVVAAPAHAATSYTWSGMGVTDSWSEAANWSPNGVPGNGDSVTVKPPTTGSCNAHVVGAPSGVTLVDLTLADYESSPGSGVCGGSLAGGSLTVSGTYDQNGAVLSTPLTIAATGSGTIRSAFSIDVHSQFAADVSVLGTLTLEGNLDDDDAVYLAGGKHVTIGAGGTLVSSGPNQIKGTTCCVDPPRVINNGTLQATGGELRLSAASLDQNGTLDTTATGSVTSDRAPNTASSGAQYTGSGSWQLGAVSTTVFTGTQTLDSDFTLALGGVGITGTHSLYGTFTLAGTGEFEWRGGLIQAAITIGQNVVLRAEGTPGGARTLYGLDQASQPISVTNHGVVSFTDGAGYYNYGGRLINASDGTLGLGAGTTISGDCCTNPGVIRNNGGRIELGTGAPAPKLDNVSFVVDGGQVIIPGGETLDLTGGGTDQLDAATIAGGGTLDVASPTSVSGTVSVGSGTTLRLKKYPGTLDGTATIGGAGKFEWRGGAMSGAITVKTAGGARIAGPVDPVNDTLSKYLTPKGGGAPSSVKFATDTTVVAGTAAVPNSVLLGVSSLTFAGDTTIGGEVELTQGSVLNTGDLTLTSSAAHPLTITKLTTSGDLTGSGAIVGAVVNSTGTVTPGTNGTGNLRIKGSFIQKPGGELVQKLLRGKPPLLTVQGTAKLAGHLLLTNGYLPALGSKRTVVTATGTLTSTLSCVATKGTGSTGSKARHWTASVSGHQLVVRSVKGRKASC